MPDIALQVFALLYNASLNDGKDTKKIINMQGFIDLFCSYGGFL